MAFPAQISRIVFASSFAAVLSAPGAALACNPIEFLFQGCREPAPARIETSLPPAFRTNPGAKLRPKIAKAHAAHVYKQTAIAPPTGAKVGSIAHFVEDPTLRSGDVVVTPDGFLVYRGHDKVHTAEDFEPLGRASGDLVKLEKASHGPAPDFATVSTPLTATKPTSPIKATQAAGDRDFSATTAN